MNYLKQSTAFTDKLGPFLDSTDGDTEEVALTIATTDVRINKNGADAAAQDVGATSPSHNERGNYSINYTTADTNTLGLFRVYIHVAGALAVWKDYTVLPAVSFDALITNGLNNLGGTAQTADHTTAIADIPNNSEFNARTLPSANYFDPAADTVANVTLVATTTTNTDMRGTEGANTITPPTTVQIWAESARTLTSGANIVLAKGVGVTGFNDLDFNAMWTGVLTESYAANDLAMTPAQAMHMIWSDLRSPQQVTTIWSDFRLDNTTIAMTFTLDDANTPTKKTRSS